MNQNLTSAINSVKAKAQNEQQSKPLPKGAEAKKTFHDKEREKRSKDPANTHLAEAKAAGTIDARIFLGTVTNATHPDHKEALQMFKSKYHMDSAKAESDLIQKACEARNAAPYEMSDPGYEQHIMRKYKPTGNITHEKLALYNIFQDALKEKWRAIGYKSDKEFIDAKASEYGLSPNESTIEMKNIQPKD